MPTTSADEAIRKRIGELLDEAELGDNFEEAEEEHADSSPPS